MLDDDEHGISRRWVGWLVLLAVCITLVAGWLQIRHNSISFDGGMNAQVARNLVEKGRYATSYRQLVDFDHRVQTGPTVLLPVAACFRLFGVTSFTAQLPNLLYVGLLMGLVVCFVSRLAGPIGGVLAFVAVAGTPGLYDFGLAVYGEIPALAFAVGGLLVVDRLRRAGSWQWAAAAGIAFGLAVLTKLIMVLVAVPVAMVVMTAWATGRGVSRGRLATFVMGVLAPLFAFEVAKMAVLGPAAWRSWWGVMVGRVLDQGLPGRGMPTTPVSAHKASEHLQILAETSGLEGWLPFLVLAVPSLLLVLLLLAGGSGRRPRIPLSVVALWLSAGTFLAWWLILTPTSRAWLRRAINGLILQEILAVIVLIWGARWIRGSVRSGPFRGVRGHGVQALVGTLVVALAVSLGASLFETLPGAVPLMEPAQEKTDADVIAAAIRELPPEAVLYGVGWFQAPVVAMLAGRSLLDFEGIGLDQYRRPLDHSYLVVDNHLTHYQPERIEALLLRTEFETVARSGPCALHRLTKILPYPPIPEPPDGIDLPEGCSPENAAYRFSSGLDPSPPLGRSNAVSGFVLDNDNRECLAVDLWVSPRAGERPRFEVRVDDRLVLAAGLEANAAGRHVVSLDAAAPPTDTPRLVELWLYRDPVRSPYTLWFNNTDLYVVKEVAFVDCPAVQPSAVGGP